MSQSILSSSTRTHVAPAGTDTPTALNSHTRRGMWLRHASNLLLVAAIGVGWFVFLSPTAVGGPVGLIWVSGTSMEPGLHTGDLVVTYERSEYAVGDVVAFEIPQGGTVIHRVIEATDDGRYLFRGDNRNYDDPWLLGPDSIIGSSVVELHNAATIAAWLTRPPALAVMVALIVLFVMLERALVPSDDASASPFQAAEGGDLVGPHVDIDLRE